MEDLISALRTRDSRVRRAALELLSKTAPDWPRSEAAHRQVPAFIAELCNNVCWDVREDAAKALGKIGDITAVKYLTKALGDETLPVRLAVAEALANIADASAVEPLIATLQDKQHYRYREAVARTLGQIGDVGAMETLVALLRDSVSDVRKAAIKALVKISLDWPQSDAARQQVPEFIVALRNRDTYVRKAAAEVLGEIGDVFAVDSLVTLLKDKDPVVSGVAAESLHKINSVNQRLLGDFLYVLCLQCLLRAERRTVKYGFFSRRTWVVCRGCGHSTYLMTGVLKVIGLIGGDSVHVKHTDSTVTVKVWSESDKSARNADIDRLVIRDGNVDNYERAVNAVVNALHSDVSRPADWCKKIPVIIEGEPALSIGAMRMLEDTFMSVQKE